MSGTELLPLAYLVSVACFAVGLKRLGRVRTARSGNALAATGMLVAVLITLVEQGLVDYRWIAGGLVLGAAAGVAIVVRAKATQMPEIVARFNGFGGAASALVALALYWRQVVEAGGPGTAAGSLESGALGAVTLVLSVLVGSTTFAGSLVAELKLRGTLGNTAPPGRTVVMAALLLGGLLVGAVATFGVGNPATGWVLLLGLVVASLLAGLVLVFPIGGADMPVVISLLNSLSGLAAAATGFALGHNLLIIVGTLVGAAGLILTRIMSQAMNRSLVEVMAGGVGETTADDAREYERVVSADPEEVAMVLEAARSVIIVPGYGLAAARAQHSLKDLAETISSQGSQVRFAIHPVAGRMPGHMNVVLAEADVPYDQLYEMDAINRDFKSTDVAIVVGANDVVNPAARETSGSPISGMPILDVDQAQRVVVIKRSLSPGYAGIKNELFERDNTVMLFGDAKDAIEQLTGELQAAAKA